MSRQSLERCRAREFDKTDSGYMNHDKVWVRVNTMLATSNWTGSEGLFLYYFFFLMIRPPPRSTLFPYTTLFRSIVVGAENVRLHRIVVLGGVETAIGVGGLVARGRDVALLVEELEHRHAPPGIVRDTGCVPVLHRGIVRPALRPVGAHGDEGVLRNAAVARFPGLHVLERELVVGIAGHLLVHVEHHQRHQHVLRIDLIDRLLAFMKVRRRIDVSAPLADVAELIDVETVPRDRVERAHLHLTEALPVRRVGTERVREINEALGGERSIEARQVRSGPRGGAVARGVSGRRRRLRCRVRPAGGLHREQRAGAYGREREQSGKARAIRHGTPPADAPRSSIPGAPRRHPGDSGLPRPARSYGVPIFRYRDYLGSWSPCQLLFLTGCGGRSPDPGARCVRPS